jgi:hypothetical protein
VTIVATKEVEQKVTPLTARQIELVLQKASHRQVGVTIHVKRVGNNLTYIFKNVEGHQVFVEMNDGGLMMVRIANRQLRPFDQEHQNRFLAWLWSGHTKQTTTGGIYGHPDDCLFEKLEKL